TGGVDRSHCPAGTDETHAWTSISTPSTTPTPTPTSTLLVTPTTPTPTPTAGGTGTQEFAVGLAEAGQNVGGWSVPAPYQFAVNWNGSTGARPVAVVYALATPGVSVTGPTVTNAAMQNTSGGSLLLLQGSGLRMRGTTLAHHVSGVSGGGSGAIPSPSGMVAEDLVLVYIDTP